MSTNKKNDHSYVDKLNEDNNYEDRKDETNKESAVLELTKNNKHSLTDKKKKSEDLGKLKQSKWHVPALLFRNVSLGQEQYEDLSPQNESYEKHNHDSFLHHLTLHHDSKENPSASNDSKVHSKIEISEKHNYDSLLHHLTVHHDSKDNPGASNDSNSHNKTEISEKHNYDSLLHHLTVHHDLKDNPGASNDSNSHNKTESSEKHNHDSFLHHLTLHREPKVDLGKEIVFKKDNQNHKHEIIFNHYTFDHDTNDNFCKLDESQLDNKNRVSKHNHDLIFHHSIIEHEPKVESSTLNNTKVQNHNHENFNTHTDKIALYHQIAVDDQNPTSSNEFKATQYSNKENYENQNNLNLNNHNSHFRHPFHEFSKTNGPIKNSDYTKNKHLMHNIFEMKTSDTSDHAHSFIDCHTKKKDNLENKKNSMKNPKLSQLKNSSNFLSENNYQHEKVYHKRHPSVGLLNESNNLFVQNLNKTTEITSSFIGSNEKTELSVKEHNIKQSEADKNVNNLKTHTSNKLVALYVSQLPPIEYSITENPSVNSNTHFLDENSQDRNSFFSPHKNKLAAFLTSQTPASNFSEHHKSFNHNKTEHSHSSLDTISQNNSVLLTFKSFFSQTIRNDKSKIHKEQFSSYPEYSKLISLESKVNNYQSSVELDVGGISENQNTFDKNEKAMMTTIGNNNIRLNYTSCSTQTSDNRVFQIKIKQGQCDVKNLRLSNSEKNISSASIKSEITVASENLLDFPNENDSLLQLKVTSCVHNNIYCINDDRVLWINKQKLLKLTKDSIVPCTCKQNLGRKSLVRSLLCFNSSKTSNASASQYRQKTKILDYIDYSKREQEIFKFKLTLAKLNISIKKHKKMNFSNKQTLFEQNKKKTYRSFRKSYSNNMVLSLVAINRSFSFPYLCNIKNKFL